MQNQTNKDRVAIVVGGAMGIGAEICQRLGAAGYTVVVADRDMEAAKGRVGSSAQQACALRPNRSTLAMLRPWHRPLPKLKAGMPAAMC